MAVPVEVITRQRPWGSGVPAGTVAVILFDELRTNVAATWYSVTELTLLKLAPISTTCEPTGPLIGLSEPIAGVAAPVVTLNVGS